jgi:hypothetical protein
MDRAFFLQYFFMNSGLIHSEQQFGQVALQHGKSLKMATKGQLGQT